MRECEGCGGSVESRFRFCPWCAAPQRRKLVEFFQAHPVTAGDESRALRVSRYLDEGHVRFSVWEDGVATAAVSLDERETARLARFVEDRRPRPATTVERLVASVRGRRSGAHRTKSSWL